MILAHFAGNDKNRCDWRRAILVGAELGREMRDWRVPAAAEGSGGKLLSAGKVRRKGGNAGEPRPDLNRPTPRSRSWYRKAAPAGTAWR